MRGITKISPLLSSSSSNVPAALHRPMFFTALFSTSSLSKLSSSFSSSSSRDKLRSLPLSLSSCSQGLTTFHLPRKRNFMKSSKTLHGLKTFKLADIGEGITEVEVLQWVKKEGDIVEEMEPVCHVQSDKASVDITSRYTGVIKKLYYKEGELAKVGFPLFDIQTEDDDDADNESQEEVSSPPSSSPSPSPLQTSSSPEHVKSPLETSNNFEASPAVRRLAREKGIDLNAIKGTGKGGRITKEDVMNFSPSSSSQSSTPDSIQPMLHLSPSSGKVRENVQVPIRGFSRAMVKTMTATTSIPHLNIGDEYDISDLVEMRRNMNKSLEKENMKITLTTILVKAMSLAIDCYPITNSKIHPSEEYYTMFGNHNICVAMDTPNGLVVPVIKNCENKSIYEIQKELNRLQKNAMSNQLDPIDLKDGTISLSNVGVVSGTYVHPLLYDNQAVIMGVGRTAVVPKFASDVDTPLTSSSIDTFSSIVKRTILYCSFSADHRHCDGATVARFNRKVKELLENPELMLIHLK